ncbi:A24 family peptidase [Tersicoccus sp. MR15.9]|uniref:A24 family peptidase n=1 Tax=Tersicoccus mangrovi TaxID=3121635 RepID=UPI002FE5E9F8
MLGRLADLAAAHPVAGVLATLACAGLLALAVVLTVVDVREHRLPDRLLLPGVAVSALLWVAAFTIAGPEAGGVGAMLRTLAAGAALFAGYLLLRIVHPPGMGFGDVKLAGLLGLHLGAAGWAHVAAGTMLAFLLGGVGGAVLLLTGRARWRTAIPFGPFMLAGAVLALVVVPAA